MSLRAKLAALVDITLGCLLVFVSVTHAHLTVRTHNGSAIVPAYWFYAPILLVMTAVTAWSLLGRRSR